jgi:hypothetical protein
MKAGLTRRHFNALAGGALAAAAWPLAARELAPFETLEFDWIDPLRSRAVPARLYWPQAAMLGACRHRALGTALLWRSRACMSPPPAM